MNPLADTHQHQVRLEAALSQAVSQLPLTVRPIAEHVIDAGGKRLRALLTVRTARLFGCENPNIYPLAAAVEMAHAATLLHDDVLDQADTRRGKTAAHHVFGTTQAILAGDALFAVANRLVAGYHNSALSCAFSEGIMWTAHGEILEIEHQGNLSSLDVYLAVIEGKTAWMIRMACEVGALHAGATAEQVALAGAYGFNLGVAFQMVDDALDFAADTGKPLGGDLREGKYTPPLIYYVESLPPAEQQRFAEHFQRMDFTETDIEFIIQAVRQQGFDNKTRALATAYLDKARTALQRLGETVPPLDDYDVLNVIIGHVLHRKA